MTAGKKILEIGCGTGEFTKRIVPSGADITAIDISPDLLEVARETIPNATVRFHIQNVEKLDFEDGCFDVVIGSSILHHLNLKPALKEIYRVLKIGGVVVFTEPNMVNPQIWMERNIIFIRKLTNSSPDETAFTRWGLKKELINLGFKNVSIRPFDFLHPFTPSLLIPFISKIGNLVERIPLAKEIAGSLLICGSKE
ncbi:MAG: class I SAM-dependent methyltransferase [Bacteroidota bacterium]|nr:class I SAM-dependent methyltransferase [Bacteroidota bacterium]